MDIDKTTRLFSEGIARTTNRRGFLKRAGQTAFFALASLASGHMLRGNASAQLDPVDPKRQKGRPHVAAAPACNPPGPYCNRGTGELTGCHGGHCHSHLGSDGAMLSCELDYQFYPGVGCWSTRVAGGYWVCCDCRCRNTAGGFTTCGCAQFSTQPYRGVDGSQPVKE